MQKNKLVVGIHRENVKNIQDVKNIERLTNLFTKNKYFGDIIRKDTIKEVLDDAAVRGYDYCLVQAIGHFIKEIPFFDYINDWINNMDFFITGHIVHKEDSFGLHNQCILVNLNYYRDFGNPSCGKKGEKVEIVVPRRSEKNIHHDYTPIWLKPTNETKVCTPVVDGWNFIDQSLRENLTVYNFHPKMRECKEYCYPHKSLKELEEQLSWIGRIIEFAPQSVFFWNTENYIDIKDQIQEPIDKIYCVAAGFKPNMFLHKFGFKDSTEVIYYDYSKSALAFKKLLISKWDGKNYPAFIKAVKEQFFIRESTHNPFGNDDYDSLWTQELERWGGEQNLHQHWLRYRKLKHTFIHCDIVKDSSKLINLVDDEGTQVIWWSNCFHTVNSHYLNNNEGLYNIYKEWVNGLANKNPNLFIFGKDYLNNSLKGGKIKQYDIPSEYSPKR